MMQVSSVALCWQLEWQLVQAAHLCRLRSQIQVPKHLQKSEQTKSWPNRRRKASLLLRRPALMMKLGQLLRSHQQHHYRQLLSQ